MAKTETVIWIAEDRAAEKLGYRPDYFRRKVKAGALPIAHRNTGGRKFQYSLQDIGKYMQETSTAV